MIDKPVPLDDGPSNDLAVDRGENGVPSGGIYLSRR